MHTAVAQHQQENWPVYRGNDLGVLYTPASTRFRIWSPRAEAVQLLLYREGAGGQPYAVHGLKKSAAGTWLLVLPGDYRGSFYCFQAMHGGKWSAEVPDPGVKATGINGLRGAIINWKETDPPGWPYDRSPRYSARHAATDAVIYELHLRDASIHPASGIRQKGGYMGLTELHTRSPQGNFTGLSHIRELGVTHVHLLPFFDYRAVDEARPEDNRYNWGYDPLHYNTPEGSYSADPAQPVVRIRELKTMIAAFHRQRLGVVMDVVYNHVANAAASSFEQLVPGYYFRRKADGRLSDATACGNETASEQPMMRRFILESLLFWAREYHLDGFRFDLMGVHDITTMRQAAARLRAFKPDLLLYGEGWTAGPSTLPESQRALKQAVSRLGGIAVFGDELRDGIKGSVFDEHDRGFVSGKAGTEASIRFGVTAACPHPQVNYRLVNYSQHPYASAPGQLVSYAECHDNHALYDKLQLSNPQCSPDEWESMHRLALTIVLTAQGIPFLHAGTEMLRSKQGVENSYQSPDSINAIDWNEKSRHLPLFRYLQALIRMRKAHPAFRMTTARQVSRYLRFDDQAPAGTVVYTLNGAAVGDAWKKIRVVYNGNADTKEIALPPGRWKPAPLPGGLKEVQRGAVAVPGRTAVILYQD